MKLYVSRVTPLPTEVWKLYFTGKKIRCDEWKDWSACEDDRRKYTATNRTKSIIIYFIEEDFFDVVHKCTLAYLYTEAFVIFTSGKITFS